VLEIEHTGSTSVPGLGQADVDITMIVADVTDERPGSPT
jgi:GrpB-like predicted nucleotidyltransferase (UPF0157 family)